MVTMRFTVSIAEVVEIIPREYSLQR